MSAERWSCGLIAALASLLIATEPGRASAQVTGHVVCEEDAVGYIGYLDGWLPDERVPVCDPTGGCEHVPESVCYYFAGAIPAGIDVVEEGGGTTPRCVLPLCMPGDLFAMSCTRPDMNGCPLFFETAVSVGCVDDFCLPAGDSDVVRAALDALPAMSVCPYTSESPCVPTTDGDGDVDADSDADIDADSDGDVDAGTDADVDADADADADVDDGTGGDTGPSQGLTIGGGGTFSCACEGAGVRRVRGARFLLLGF